jgi:hypothetical protein
MAGQVRAPCANVNGGVSASQSRELNRRDEGTRPAKRIGMDSPFRARIRLCLCLLVAFSIAACGSVSAHHGGEDGGVASDGGVSDATINDSGTDAGSTACVLGQSTIDNCTL